MSVYLRRDTDLAVLIGGWAAGLCNQQYIQGAVLIVTLILGAVTDCAALLVLWPAGIMKGILVAQRINRGEAVGQR